MLPIHAQFRRILEARDTDGIGPEATRIARLGFISERTGWSPAEIATLSEGTATDLITFWQVKDLHDRAGSRAEIHLERIADKLADMTRDPAPLMSYRLERRVLHAMDILVGTGEPPLDAEPRARIGDDIPLFEVLERFLARYFDHDGR